MAASSPNLVRWLRRTIIAAFVLFAALQLVPVERSNPPVVADVDVPGEVGEILRRACYDCHSHETRWPWYSYVAPASWYVVDHVEEARGDLNFSRWPTYDFEAQEHAFDEIREEVASGEMPLPSYLLLHPSSRLNDDDRERLLRWAGGPER